MEAILGRFKPQRLVVCAPLRWQAINDSPEGAQLPFTDNGSFLEAILSFLPNYASGYMDTGGGGGGDGTGADGDRDRGSDGTGGKGDGGNATSTAIGPCLALAMAGKPQEYMACFYR